MKHRVRVGIVVERFVSPGGIQTCLMELVTGLNQMGIVPEIAWDEPQDWGALGDPDVQTTFGGGRLGIRSSTLRRLPFWLGGRLRPLSFRFARLGLDRYDFVYSFELGARMPRGVSNVCVMSGPSIIRMPGDEASWRRLYDLRELRKILSLLTSPLTRPDGRAHYVTHSDWIADLFLDRYGFRPQVIWPPVRSRVLPPEPLDRSGFLFLSRLAETKRADSMLSLAEAYPDQKVTIAGAMLDSNRAYVARNRAYVARLRERARRLGLSNVDIVENPSEQRVAALLTSHQVFVFPALWEHFGIVTVEAIQAGLVPVVHDTGGQREIVPFASLRFLSDAELVDRAGYVLGMPDAERSKIVNKLRHHVQRGSPEHYREEMLRPLRLLQDQSGSTMTP